jgi:hypothetical protein
MNRQALTLSPLAVRPASGQAPGGPLLAGKGRLLP